MWHKEELIIDPCLFFLSFSNIEARAFYSYALQRLPGVVRSGKPRPDTTESLTNSTDEPWRPFNRSEHGGPRKELLHGSLWFSDFSWRVFVFVLHTQVPGVHGWPRVHSGLLSACGAGCSQCLQRRYSGVTEELHLCLGEGTDAYLKCDLCFFFFFWK